MFDQKKKGKKHVAPKAPIAIATALVIAVPIAASIVHCLLPRTSGDAYVLSTRLNKYQWQDRPSCKDRVFEEKCGAEGA